MDGSLEKRLGDLYWSNADIISESAPVLNAPRADALVAFNLTGVPARGSAGGDRYHYTGLREAFGAEYESYFTPSYASASVRHLDLEGGRAGFMNGFHSGAEPLTETPEGVLYGSLAAAAVRYPDLIGRYYNRLSGEHGDALSALNTVFAQDGAFVYVPRGVRVARPLLVTFAHYSEDEALRCFARSLFVFERDSEAQLVIDDRSEGDGAALDCQVRELFVGSGARVELVELLRLGDRSTLVSSSFAEQWGVEPTAYAFGRSRRPARAEQSAGPPARQRGREPYQRADALRGGRTYRFQYELGARGGRLHELRAGQGHCGGRRHGRVRRPPFTWRRTPSGRRLTSRTTICCSAMRRMSIRSLSSKFMPITSSAAMGRRVGRLSAEPFTICGSGACPTAMRAVCKCSASPIR